MPIVWSPDNDALDPYLPYGSTPSERHAIDAERERVSAEASEDAQARDWRPLGEPNPPTLTRTRLRVISAWLQQTLAVASGDACGIGRLGMGRTGRHASKSMRCHGAAIMMAQERAALVARAWKGRPCDLPSPSRDCWARWPNEPERWCGQCAVRVLSDAISALQSVVVALDGWGDQL